MKKLLLVTLSIGIAFTSYAFLQAPEKPVSLDSLNSEILGSTESNLSELSFDNEITLANLQDIKPGELTDFDTVNSQTLSEETNSTQEQPNSDTESVENVNTESAFSALQPSPNQVAEIRNQRRQQLVTQLDGLLSTEQNDVTWQNDLTQQATHALNLLPALNGIAVSSTFCGVTVCKMTLSAKDTQVFEQMRGVVPGIAMFLGSDTWGFSNRDALITDVYIARPGEVLPFI